MCPTRVGLQILSRSRGAFPILSLPRARAHTLAARAQRDEIPTQTGITVECVRARVCACSNRVNNLVPSFVLAPSFFLGLLPLFPPPQKSAPSFLPSLGPIHIKAIHTYFSSFLRRARVRKTSHPPNGPRLLLLSSVAAAAAAASRGFSAENTPISHTTAAAAATTAGGG